VIDRILDAGPGLLDDPLPIGYRHLGGRHELERHLDSALDVALDLIGAADLGAVACQEQSRRLARPPDAGRISSNVLLDRVDADAMIRWVAAEPLARAADDDDRRPLHWDTLRSHDEPSPLPEHVTVHLGDRTLTLPATALDAVRTLSNGGRIRVGDLPGLDESSCIVLAKRLVRESACVIDAFG
jgi:hypothetical protein